MGQAAGNTIALRIKDLAAASAAMMINQANDAIKKIPTESVDRTYRLT